MSYNNCVKRRVLACLITELLNLSGDVTSKEQTNTLLCPFGDRIWKLSLLCLLYTSDAADE